MKVTTPVKPTVEIDHSACRLAVVKGRKESGMTILSLSKAMKISPSKLWLMLSPLDGAGWTEELFQRAMAAIAKRNSKTT